MQRGRHASPRRIPGPLTRASLQAGSQPKGSCLTNGPMLAHIFLALVIQVAVARLSRSWFAGAAAAGALAISREITQAEYRWIEQFGGHLRANMPWWGGLDPRVWQRADSWLDWLVPVMATLILAAIFSRRSAR